jgi:hypothetical protein
VGFGIKVGNKGLRNKLDINIVNTQNLYIELKNIVGDEK